MNLLGWAVVGLIAGVIAGRLTNRRGGGCLSHVVVGVIGAFIGGALDVANGGDGVNDFGWHSIGVAAIGATIFLAVLNALSTGRLRR